MRPPFIFAAARTSAIQNDESPTGPVKLVIAAGEFVGINCPFLPINGIHAQHVVVSDADTVG
jgi:hypothetical protein